MLGVYCNLGWSVIIVMVLKWWDVMNWYFGFILLFGFIVSFLNFCFVNSLRMLFVLVVEILFFDDCVVWCSIYYLGGGYL